MNKKVNLLYFSATDNTSSVVKSIASSISDKVNEYNITLERNRIESLNFTENDLVIIGVPVYAGRVPKFLVEYFNKIKGMNTAAVFVVTYGNRDYEDALLELKDTFEKNGFIGIAAAVFVGEHSYTSLLAENRPNTNDLKIAEEFGCRIKAKLESIADINNINNLKVPGNLPYIVKKKSMPPMAPEANDNCLQCKICYENCPTEAIDLNNCKNTDATKCIKCCRCINRCPAKAKNFNHPEFDNIKNMLINNFSNVSNNPETYL